VEKYPRSVKFSLSNRIVEISISVMESIIEAIYTSSRLHILRRINVYIEKLRVFFRSINIFKINKDKQKKFKKMFREN